MSKIPQARPLGARMRSDVFADVCFWRSGLADRWSARLRSRATTWQPSPFLLRGCATRSPKGEAWWSQTGSNRRPHACKARALQAELWPRTRRRMLTLIFETLLLERRARSIKVVGLGRLELPTSRLSSARSNQLSYKPLTREA